MMLAQRWAGQDVSGWWMSEKFDGVRAFWDGFAIRTRTWREVLAPGWFLAKLPPGVALDGELWGGRGTFQIASELSRFSRASDSAWRSMAIMVFDWPTCDAIGFEQRNANLRAFENEVVRPVNQVRCASTIDARREMSRVVDAGGEGVMMRRPGHHYSFERSRHLLKLKPATSD